MRLTAEQIDALIEVVNIGVGRAASSLNSLVAQPIELCVPRIETRSIFALRAELAGAAEPINTAVVQGFQGAISGKAMLAFPQRSGVSLARLLAGDDIIDADTPTPELDYDLAGILEEIGNIVLNGVLGSLANLFEEDFRYHVPTLCRGVVADALLDSDEPTGGPQPTCLLADARFGLADSRIRGSLLLAFNTGELGPLVDRLLTGAAD